MFNIRNHSSGEFLLLIVFIFLVSCACHSFANPAIRVRIGRDLISHGAVREVDRHIVPDFLIEIEVPVSEELTSVMFIFDDTCIPNEDTEILLYERDGPSCAVELTQRSIGRSRVRYTFERFTLPLWQAGRNRLEIVANTSAGRGSFELTFNYRLPTSNLGIGRAPRSALGTSFRLRDIPIFVDRCRYIFCKDADQDGLLDLWENIAVEVLRPTLALDEDDEFFENQPGHHIRIFTRVFPIENDGRDYILFKHYIAWTRDYGTDVWPFVVGAHNGDLTSARSSWEVIDDYEIRMQHVWTRGHSCDTCSPETHQWGPDEVEFNSEGFSKIRHRSKFRFISTRKVR